MRLQCPRGHDLTEENIYMSKGDGIRRCRICRRINDENYRIKKNISREGTRSDRERPVTYLNPRGPIKTKASRPTSELMEDAKQRLLAPRSITSEFCGDPAPGWSALERRQGA